MLDAIPQELFTIMRKYLSYNNLQNINTIIVIDKSDKDLFANSQLFYQTNVFFQKALNHFEMSSNELYDMIDQSALDLNNVYEILFAITSNHILNETKYDYNLKINYEKTDYSYIKNTITILNIIMMTMEHNIIDDFVINNPYHYTSINITNTLLHYFHCIVRNNYTVIKDIERNSFRFNLMMFECPWYKSNINIYHVFLLYLLNIKVISSQNTEDIYMICSYNKDNKDNKDNNIMKIQQRERDEFVSSVLNMFQDVNHTIKLNEMIHT
jgi:hypothetical protein